MDLVKRAMIKGIILVSLTLIIAIALGITLSRLNDMEAIETMLEQKQPSLPSVLLDRNGEVVTEFYSDEKRDIVTLDMVPEYLVQGLIQWEDESFYHHRGFNPLAIMRATVNNAMGRPVSGASTLTQQLARTIFLSLERSLVRKIKEIWIAVQLEKKYTKNEILTLYLNHVPLGYGTNGVQAASKFYFDKNVNELSHAEAASMITLISNPTFYSFIKFPKNHKQKQREVLNKMARYGIITDVENEQSFNQFWLQWRSTTHSSRGAFFNREDKAPYFSDWVMNTLEREMPNVDIFRDGLTIHSTVDIRWNQMVEEMMVARLERSQKIFEAEQIKIYNNVQNYYMDSIALMSEVFTLSNINIDVNRDKVRAITDFSKDINPSLNLTSQILGLNLVETVTDIMFDREDRSEDLLSQVQGAFIALDNKTGQILVMIGGKNFDPNHRFNYAMQSRRQPGSSFKPLVYSAALDSGMFTPASIIQDRPHVFTFDSNDPDDWYRPYNYGARYHGQVTFRQALRRSLNIPACKIFYTIGKNNEYKVPIDRAALLLGINAQSEIDARFKPEISTVLGTGSVAPIEMAQAFSTFANGGKRSIPNTILYVEDRNGRIIYQPWKDLQKYYRENNKRLQIIPEETAFIMSDILKDSVISPDGTLARTRMNIINNGKEFPPVDFAAKTGTTQNWSDAWVIGFSPLITATGWVGFNKYGLSLGYEQPGASVVGPMWMEFMRAYHEDKGTHRFVKPDRVLSVQICTESGKLFQEGVCQDAKARFEYFLPGTQPVEYCTRCGEIASRQEKSIEEISEIYERTYSNKSIDHLFDTRINVDRSLISNYEYSDEDINNELDLIDIDLSNNYDPFEIDTDPVTTTTTTVSNSDGSGDNGIFTTSTTVISNDTINSETVTTSSTINTTVTTIQAADGESTLDKFEVNEEKVRDVIVDTSGDIL
jgi:penicillin-binding protein 1A